MTVRTGPEGGADERIPGCVLAVVVDVDDPDRQGRVRVSYPWLDGQMQSTWASIAAPMAGPGRGMFLMPEVDDEVVVTFERGRMNHPIVIGSTWNGQDDTPDPSRRIRMWRSVNGHKAMMVDSTPDSGDSGAVIIEDAHGNIITLGNGLVTVSAVGTLLLKGANVVFEVRGVTRVVSPVAKVI